MTRSAQKDDPALEEAEAQEEAEAIADDLYTFDIDDGPDPGDDPDDPWLRWGKLQSRIYAAVVPGKKFPDPGYYFEGHEDPEDPGGNVRGPYESRELAESLRELDRPFDELSEHRLGRVFKVTGPEDEALVHQVMEKVCKLTEGLRSDDEWRERYGRKEADLHAALALLHEVDAIVKRVHDGSSRDSDTSEWAAGWLDRFVMLTGEARDAAAARARWLLAGRPDVPVPHRDDAFEAITVTLRDELEAVRAKMEDGGRGGRG